MNSPIELKSFDIMFDRGDSVQKCRFVLCGWGLEGLMIAGESTN